MPFNSKKIGAVTAALAMLGIAATAVPAQARSSQRESPLPAGARSPLCHGCCLRPELDLPGGRFAVGDRIVIKRNDRGRGVDNGDRGRVLVSTPQADRSSCDAETGGSRSTAPISPR